MEPTVSTTARSSSAALESLQFGEEIQRLMAAPPPETAGSFTALLELPPTQAMELLHSPEQSRKTHLHPLPANLTFPTSTALIERAAKFSVFAGEHSSPETSSVPSSSNASLGKVKSELVDTDSNPDSSPELLVSEPPVKSNAQKAAKRKEREKKAKGSTKKSKLEEAEKLPYVHVRARRGQATDSHSLAERARREKINARMKLLQELVPGCTKISGTTLVLDEIISHVQSLQRQVEFLSMRLAEVDPRIDFNLDSMLTAESGSLMDSNFSGMLVPLMWPEGHVNGGSRQQWYVDAVQQPVWQREEDNHNLIASDNSLLSYDSSGNSGSNSIFNMSLLEEKNSIPCHIHSHDRLSSCINYKIFTWNCEFYGSGAPVESVEDGALKAEEVDDDPLVVYRSTEHEEVEEGINSH